MTWTTEIVRARFLEAAATAGKLPAPPRHTASGFWPAFNATFEDMAHWGSARLAEERELRMQRIPPTAGAITRHDEVVDWVSDYIEDEERRRLIWTWSICQISGASFAARCRKLGWVRGTAHRRLSAVIEAILKQLRKNNVLLRLPEEIYLRQEQPVSGSPDGMVGGDANAPPISPTAVIFEGARPSDLLTSPSAIEDFEKHLIRTNDQRRKERERKKRKLLGLEQSTA